MEKKMVGKKKLVYSLSLLSLQQNVDEIGD